MIISCKYTKDASLAADVRCQTSLKKKKFAKLPVETQTDMFGIVLHLYLLVTPAVVLIDSYCSC
jgi:hypothetical protein